MSGGFVVFFPLILNLLKDEGKEYNELGQRMW